MKTEFTHEEKQEIVKLYQDNVDIEKIMDIFHCEEKYLRMILKNNEIDRRYHTFQKELYDRMIKLYQNGFTYNQIMDSLLVQEPVIRKTLRKNNIQLRSYSDNNRRYYRNQHYFDEIDTPNKAYVLGLLYADGCNCIDHYAITITLQENDLDTLIAVKNELSYGGPIRKIEKSKINPAYKDAYTLVVNDQYLSGRLNELGLVNNKSLILKHPTFLSDNLIPHFIRGYFDGDGCIWVSDKFKDAQISFVGTKDVCGWIYNYIHLNNINCFFEQPERCNENTIILKVSGVLQCYKLMTLLYNNSELKMYRKYQKFLHLCDNLTERNLVCLNETNK